MFKQTHNVNGGPSEKVSFFAVSWRARRTSVSACTGNVSSWCDPIITWASAANPSVQAARELRNGWIPLVVLGQILENHQKIGRIMENLL